MAPALPDSRATGPSEGVVSVVSSSADVLDPDQTRGTWRSSSEPKPGTKSECATCSILYWPVTPSGSILRCRVPDNSSMIIRVDPATGGRQVLEAAPESWQLLDGQQLINALVSLFTNMGRYGRFYLHMTIHREPPGPASRRRTKDRALSYIAWRGRLAESGAAEPGLEPVLQRNQHLDLSCWYGWVEEANPNRAEIVMSDFESGTRLAAEILQEI